MATAQQTPSVDDVLGRSTLVAPGGGSGMKWQMTAVRLWASTGLAVRSRLSLGLSLAASKSSSVCLRETVCWGLRDYAALPL